MSETPHNILVVPVQAIEVLDGQCPLSDSQTATEDPKMFEELIWSNLRIVVEIPADSSPDNIVLEYPISESPQGYTEIKLTEEEERGCR